MYTSIRQLDIKNSINLQTFEIKDNPSLTTICVSSLSDVSTFWKKDSHTNYSTCEPLAFEETESIVKSEVLKAYNLHGQEVSINTTGEVIILLYDNGVKEKTYVVK